MTARSRPRRRASRLRAAGAAGVEAGHAAKPRGTGLRRGHDTTLRGRGTNARQRGRDRRSARVRREAQTQLEGSLIPRVYADCRRTFRTSVMAQQPLPLTGIRVVDYRHFLAGPHVRPQPRRARRRGHQGGASEVGRRRPRSMPHFIDGQSGYFLQQNMGKQGLCINLKDPRGLAMMHKLDRHSRRFHRELSPGALDKLGLGYCRAVERQSTPRLLLDLGLRPHRPRLASRRLRPHRRGQERHHADGRHARAKRRRCCASRSATCTRARMPSPRSAPPCSGA